MDAASDEARGAWLVFGLTGQVGQAMRTLLHASDPPVLAVSRRPQRDEGRVAWQRSSLQDFASPARAVDAIVSLGPLDAFAQWFETSPLAPARVVALGSTSVHAKKHSPDRAERALAVALRDAERRLAAAAAARGTVLTVLRPTLTYGHGRDRNLSRIVGLARRWRVLPLPWHARGLRQPVHVEDVASVVLGRLRARSSCPGFFDLPGGETLPFDVMLARALTAGAPTATVVRLPGPLFRAGVGALRGMGLLDAAGVGVLARLDQDQAYDPEPARIALGHYPRGFQPSAATFPE
jgi:nucleoside-diphosphate-sugar epimerase